MSKIEAPVAGYRFDDVYIDAANRQLWRNGNLLQLSSKYFDALLLLVRKGGELVQKEHIFREVWDGVTVTDSALTQCIKDIRKQLGDDASNPRYIKTVPKHGYVFIAEAVESSSDEISVDSASAMVATGRRPYKFLDYYTEQDASFFFGRELEVEAICSQVLAHRSFVLHGRSGVGKSSILRAGLMPHLKSRGHLVFVIRSFTDPVHQMVGALSALAGLGFPAGIEAELAECLSRVEEVYPNRGVIFLLDQFEEFFSLLSQESRRKFIDVIKESFSNEALPFRLVFALREDVLTEMSSLKSSIPEIFHHEYRLGRLSREQATRAIEGPAEAVGCGFEKALIERLLNDLGEDGGIDPPQLQIVCDSIYDSRDISARLTVYAYESLGATSRILANYLERVLSRFNVDDLNSAKDVLKALVSADGRRLVLRVSDLGPRVQGLSYPRSRPIDDLIEEMIDARVVRRRRQDGEGWVELAHDFLIPEISSWMTAEEDELKRARGVFERSMENYNTNGLLIDSDALDLLLPFGERLGLTGGEADLLASSLLNRGRPLPHWLVRTSPSAPRLILDAFANSEADIRLGAIYSCPLSPDPKIKGLLRRASLSDRALKVRKAASIALADRFGRASREIISERIEGERVGLIRQALSLAVIRDYDKNLVRLLGFSIPRGLFIVLALVWVRLKRGWPDFLRRGLGGTLGGATSGLVGGLILGSVLTMARGVGILEATSLVMVLVILGIIAGTLGGIGVCSGVVAATHVAYRHSKWWTVIGGALGGAAIGGITKLLGNYTLRTLFGGNPLEVTGAFEGAIIGAGLALGILLADLLTRKGGRPLGRISGATIGTICACVILALVGRNLFSGSIEIVARSFVDSQIRMDLLAPFFGEVSFGRTTQIALGTMEGLMFGAWTMVGMELFFRPHRQS